MGAPLPDLPNEGTPLAGSLHRFAAQVVAWMRAYQPVSSPTVRVRTSTSGTAFEAAPRAGAAPAAATTLPFVFLFVQTSTTGGTWVQGKAWLAGVDTAITSQPTTITGVTTSTKYWIKHDFAAGTVAWFSGTSYPAPSDTYEIYRMLEITCSSSVIASFICPHPCDIHATAKST